jgi:hypothetical protein
MRSLALWAERKQFRYSSQVYPHGDDDGMLHCFKPQFSAKDTAGDGRLASHLPLPDRRLLIACNRPVAKSRTDRSKKEDGTEGATFGKPREMGHQPLSGLRDSSLTLDAL